MTATDALREAARRIQSRIAEIEGPVIRAGGYPRGEKAALIAGYRGGLGIVEAIYAELPIPEPVPDATGALPLREDLCAACGMPIRPDELADGHPECREQE